jgi:ubiquitin carboxyl-terminal hydrolase 25/28
MQKQIEALNGQIEKAYASLNQKPYYLHAICIHDGNAYSGHYYALIYDRFSQKWRKFNDIRVTDLTEEDVFREANGGHGHMTAYWLVYVSEE